MGYFYSMVTRTLCKSKDLITPWQTRILKTYFIRRLHIVIELHQMATPLLSVYVCWAPQSLPSPKPVYVKTSEFSFIGSFNLIVRSSQLWAHGGWLSKVKLFFSSKIPYSSDFVCKLSGDVFYSVYMLDKLNVSHQLRGENVLKGLCSLLLSTILFKIIVFYWMCHQNETGNNHY